MQTLTPHHAEHPILTTPHPANSHGHVLSLGFASLTLAALAIAVSFVHPIALSALPMSILAFAIGLLEVKTTLDLRDNRLGLALLACLLSLAAFIFAVDASSSVRRLNHQPPPENSRQWVQPGSPTGTP